MFGYVVALSLLQNTNRTHEEYGCKVKWKFVIVYYVYIHCMIGFSKGVYSGKADCLILARDLVFNRKQGKPLFWPTKAKTKKDRPEAVVGTEIVHNRGQPLTQHA